MISKTAFALAAAAFFSSACVTAQEETKPPQMTMGNGVSNSITVAGLSRTEGHTSFSEIRVDGDHVASFRADSHTLVFPEVTVAGNSFIVLHPVMDGRPNGDMVSGFAYLTAGTHQDVTLRIDHPADPGSKFLVMLHRDVDEDRVLDFVFVEDGINVEDTAVFEGMRMIAHIFAVPE